MAMGPAKGQAATLQVEMVCVDELVAVDDRLRRLDAVVDWGFVRCEAEPYYAADVGRPSIDPIVLVKLMLVGALEGIDSMRELLRVASMRVDIRRFVGYGFGERLPVHQTISHAQTRRFVDARLFERLFLRSVALCREHGLIDGTHLSVDGFHVEADAALASLRASLAPVDDDEVAAGTPGASAEALAPDDSGDGDVRAQTPERARFVCPELASVGADQGFGAERVWNGVAALGVTAFVAPRRPMLAADGEPKTDPQRAAHAARERCRTAHGVWAYVRRMADAE